MREEVNRVLVTVAVMMQHPVLSVCNDIQLEPVYRNMETSIRITGSLTRLSLF
jgi:hypothetical protein